jgi:uncharacterized RDD family membrane protein YckC
VVDRPAQPPESAGVGRRVGAIVYDTLLIVAVLMVATLPFLPFLHGRVLVPAEVGWLAYVYWIWEIAVIAAFFGYFWTRRGQTVGMLAWRLRLQRPDGSAVTWGDSLLRLGIVAVLLLPFVPGYWLVWHQWQSPTARTIALNASLAPILLSYAWIWIDRDRLAWHDRWSRTRVVVLPRREK